MSNNPVHPVLDKRAVRRSFDRAAPSYDAAAVLQHEVCRRSLERLDFIRHAPARILDAGCGTGNAWRGLVARYPGARLVALDLAPGMLRQAGAAVAWHQRLLGRAPAAICGDLEQLPLAAACIDLAWSNLALQWVNALPQAFAEMRRVLAPGGLFMFTTFGPDTLKELRAAQMGTDGHTHVSGFTDMHDIGDLLVQAGFADPVIDMETFTLTYPDVKALMRDLKAIGAHNAAVKRPPTLSGRAWLEAVIRNYEPLRRDGKLPATFEVVYGHAWRPTPRLGPGGRPVIDIKPVGGA
ncbi:MAG: malonyl-ACP O-methyltransferase BioC [Burkholderiales bacterium]|jgi:malonyl-CoA O-methyltransferase|nr:malonyl-ACP O-methyltransferase BioC [Burkholderiales bacterium]